MAGQKKKKKKKAPCMQRERTSCVRRYKGNSIIGEGNHSHIGMALMLQHISVIRLPEE